MRSLLKSNEAFLDITIAISVGIVFAALMVISYIIWTLRAQLVRSGTGVTPAALNNSIANITGGYDQTIKESRHFGVTFGVNRDHRHPGSSTRQMFCPNKIGYPRYSPQLPHDVTIGLIDRSVGIRNGRREGMPSFLNIYS